MSEPNGRRRGTQLFRTLESIWAVWAVHSDGIVRFVAMCANRDDANAYARDMSHVGDVYIIPHNAEKYWRSYVDPPTIITTKEEGLSLT